MPVRKFYLKRNGARGRSTAQMDEANRGMCYALRHPPDGSEPMKYVEIQKLVRKTDGRIPRISSIQLAATTYTEKKDGRGRPSGSKCTSKAEDKKSWPLFTSRGHRVTMLTAALFGRPYRKS